MKVKAKTIKPNPSEKYFWKDKVTWWEIKYLKYAYANDFSAQKEDKC